MDQDPSRILNLGVLTSVSLKGAQKASPMELEHTPNHLKDYTDPAVSIDLTSSHMTYCVHGQWPPGCWLPQQHAVFLDSDMAMMCRVYLCVCVGGVMGMEPMVYHMLGGWYTTKRYIPISLQHCVLNFIRKLVSEGLIGDVIDF